MDTALSMDALGGSLDVFSYLQTFRVLGKTTVSSSVGLRTTIQFLDFARRVMFTW